jgi:hypothetical protein
LYFRSFYFIIFEQAIFFFWPFRLLIQLALMSFASPSRVYSDDQWSRAEAHNWIQTWMPRYVIDINRDSQLQHTYQAIPHLLVRGIARSVGSDYRFVIHQSDGHQYIQMAQDEVDDSLPVVFKPMGSPIPTASS